MKELKSLNKYFLKYKWHLIAGVIFIAFTNYFKVYAPSLIKEGIDFVEQAISDENLKNTVSIPSSITWLNNQGWTNFKPSDFLHTNPSRSQNVAQVTAILSLIFGLIFLLSGVFLFFTRVTIIIMSRRIEYDQKNEIFSQYQILSSAFFKRNNTGDLMNRISEDVGKVRMYLGPAVMYTVGLIFLIGFVLYEMISISPKLTLYTLLPLPVLSVSIYLVSSMINKKSERVQRKQSEMSTFVQETTSGVRVLKAYNREKSYLKFFKEDTQAYKRLTLDLVKVEALFMPLIVALVGLSTILATYLGSIEAIEHSNFTKGDIVQFVIYVNMLTWPFASVGWVTSLVNKAEASQERINEFLNEKPDIVSPNNSPTTINGEITFKDVHFAYPDTGIKALQGINFSLPQGKTLGITGRTGSGKSTIANLISRQFDTNLGKILIDQIDVKKIHLESLRSAIGTVPQDVFLFSDTIKNNISFSGDNYSDHEITQAAKDADIYGNIMEFPDKFETLLGERGINLSGGQKQRVSIARAIIKKPNILIFDDCLSAVDTETEEKILSSLKRIMKDRTSIIISHRISSIMHADQILVLENGKATEVGSHDDLLKKGGYYAELCQKQLLEE